MSVVWGVLVCFMRSFATLLCVFWQTQSMRPADRDGHHRAYGYYDVPVEAPCEVILYILPKIHREHSLRILHLCSSDLFLLRLKQRNRSSGIHFQL